MIAEYVTPVAGFITRPDAPNHGNYPNSYIWIGRFPTHPGKADEATQALKDNLPYIESSEPETIGFVIFKGDDVVHVWERYTSESALRDIHHKSEGYLRMREKIGPLIKSREVQGYRAIAGFLTKEGGII
jgi:quinol monooxygenase YgiN